MTVLCFLQLQDDPPSPEDKLQENKLAPSKPYSDLLPPKHSFTDDELQEIIKIYPAAFKQIFGLIKKHHLQNLRMLNDYLALIKKIAQWLIKTINSNPPKDLPKNREIFFQSKKLVIEAFVFQIITNGFYPGMELTHIENTMLIVLLNLKRYLHLETTDLYNEEKASNVVGLLSASFIVTQKAFLEEYEHYTNAEMAQKLGIDKTAINKLDYAFFAVMKDDLFSNTAVKTHDTDFYRLKYDVTNPDATDISLRDPWVEKQMSNLYKDSEPDEVKIEIKERKQEQKATEAKDLTPEEEKNCAALIQAWISIGLKPDLFEGISGKDTPLNIPIILNIFCYWVTTKEAYDAKLKLHQSKYKDRYLKGASDDELSEIYKYMQYCKQKLEGLGNKINLIKLNLELLFKMLDFAIEKNMIIQPIKLKKLILCLFRKNEKHTDQEVYKKADPQIKKYCDRCDALIQLPKLFIPPAVYRTNFPLESEYQFSAQAVREFSLCCIL